MSVVFDDFLQSAESLLNNPNSKEIDFRNLMSRSYYALFHLSREIAETLPLPNSKNNKYGSHQKVIAQFEQNPKTKQFAYFINQRKLARCKADYDIHENIMKLEARQHLLAVKGTIKKLELLKANP